MTNKRSAVYIGLVHHPVYNKNMEVVTTSVTNMDLHDISRTSTTYGVEKYYVIHPSTSHQEVTQDIINYWNDGYGGKYNPDRKTAFARVVLKSFLEEAIEDIGAIEGVAPMLVSTDARIYPNTVSYAKLRKQILTDSHPILILFGTGWGLVKEVMNSCDYILEPIHGAGPYNHLSVRAAVAIILDRLLAP